jgi:hypothetical protein
MNDALITSLRDINQRLKEKGTERITKNRIVFRVWTKLRNTQEFHSEASTLNFFNKKWPKNKCPYCSSLFGGRNLEKQDNKAWTFRCPGCKSILKVFKE